MASGRVSEKKIVIYHGSCPDGFSAAYSAWVKFRDKAEYHGVSHADRPLDLAGREVYFLDIAYKPEVMRRVASKAKKVTVIDHHVTAADSVRLADESVYDLQHSAAYLSWKYFHPKNKVPRLLLHVEDEDIWKFKLAHTSAVNARLELVPFDFKEWHKIVTKFEKTIFRKKFIQEGDLLSDYRNRMVRRFMDDSAVEVKFEGHKILAVNAPRPFASELGHALCRARPPMAIVWQERGSGIAVSLRSNGKIDVAKIAAKHGGGGHKAASGFLVPRGKKKPWTYVK